MKSFVDTTRHQYQMTASRDYLLSIVQVDSSSNKLFSFPAKRAEAKNTSQNAGAKLEEVLATTSLTAIQQRQRRPLHNSPRSLSEPSSSHFAACMLKKVVGLCMNK
eukprot:scaffold10482_cov89-Skeletonema_marinoi.AAC.2